MTPIHFGRADRTLFGLLHEAADAPSTAVLLCPPFGQEAIRAHRLYRVLAERLARTGVAALRFDYYGTGDSLGDDLDGDLHGWQDDVLTAHHELVRRSKPSAVVWLGLRLGASLAALAARQAPAELARLVLCTPILDGAEYLAQLRSRHVSVIERAVGLPPMPRPTQVAERDPASYTDEALGFALSPVLRDELSAMTLAPVLQASQVDTMWLRDPNAPVPDVAAHAALAARARELTVNDSVDWMANTPENGTLIPPRLMVQLIECMELRQ